MQGKNKIGRWVVNGFVIGGWGWGWGWGWFVDGISIYAYMNI